MAKTNPFQQFTESITAPIGGAIRGVFRGLAPGMAKQHDLDKQKIQTLLESEAGRRLYQKSQITMNEARTRAMDRGEGLYGGGGGEVSKYEQIKTLAFSLEKVTDEDLEKSIRSQIQSLLDEIKKEGKKTDNRDRFSGGDDFVGPPAPTRKPRTGEMETSKSAAEYFQPQYEAPTEWLRTKEVPEVFNEIGQAPKTFPQIGVESINDQATLQEMQKALPDIDIKSEYEGDPKGMETLIELWRQKKLNKSNIRGAFRKIQASAQQSLGIKSNLA